MPIHLIGSTLEWKPAGAWLTIPPGAVEDFDGSSEAAQSDIGVGFGDTALTRATFKIKRSALGGLPTARTPIRVTPSVDAVSAKAFVGIIVHRSGVEVVTLECEGILSDIARRLKDTYTPLRRLRPIATKTTASSVEDPSNGSYAGGLINEALWRAGLRPYAQSGSYPTADGYYECDQALFAADFGWLAGDDGYAELLRCARAAGGQIYQRDDGVVVYKQPYALISTPTYTLSDVLANATDSLGVYGDIDEDEPTTQYASKIVGRWTPRAERQLQLVIEDKTPRLVQPDELITIPLICDHPLTQIELTVAGAFAPEVFVVQRLDGDIVAQSPSNGYNHSVVLEGQRVTITYQNTSDFPHWIYGITIKGYPVTPNPAQTISVGSGAAVLEMEDNILIQNASHAQRLAQIALAYYGQVRLLRTLSECPYHPARVVGETVALTDSALGITAVPHLIIAREYQEGAATARYTLVDVSGLPVIEDYFLVGTMSYAGQSKKLTW